MRAFGKRGLYNNRNRTACGAFVQNHTLIHRSATYSHDSCPGSVPLHPFLASAVCPLKWTLQNMSKNIVCFLDLSTFVDTGIKIYFKAYNGCSGSLPILPRFIA